MPGGESIYASFRGQRQGEIRGGVTAKGHEGTLAIQSLGNGISVPIDQASARAVGHGQHHPLTFTLQLDQSVPLLLNALVNNENLTRSVFGFYRADTTGAETNHYTIELVNAQIASYEAIATSGATNLVTFGLVYQKITWTWNKGGITASDDWQAPALG
jgi:type VI secretion system secreted protein Hcp